MLAIITAVPPKLRFRESSLPVCPFYLFSIFPTTGDIEKRCNFPCFLLLKPVCGSDGMVYSNECALRGASCKSGEPITVVYDKLKILESERSQEICKSKFF